jgi:hypothetical protein
MTPARYLPAEGWSSHEVRCDADGEYEITWDNYASYMTDKCVLYQLQLVKQADLVQGVSSSDGPSSSASK